MSTLKIYHNPRCSKSREALKLLEENGAQAEVIKYLDTPPNENEIRNILQMLGISARDLMRTKEAIYKELNLKEVKNDDTLIKAMAEHPKLIERPIVIKDNKAVIGRPPVKVLDLLNA
ncbi:arsenate reductase (glutaredoxin) [Sulfurimonas sp.]|uniref:arsenate reductase (glutaredoxin) n=1 Tax=Sulfurimonas sp. TaxID=2022749 RepID=UPI002625480E|nr:arsenate reductase (glutaredoxin) [Sulfurimonas sp.]